MAIVLDPEFKDFLGPLDPESRQALENSLIADGCRDSVVVWPQPDMSEILLDGYNRYEICEQRGIPYHTTYCPEAIKTREQAIEWIVNNQRARRNLTRAQLQYLCGKIYGAEKKNQEANLDQRWASDSSSGKICHSETTDKTRDRIAAEFGMSPRSVHNAAQFAHQVDNIAAKHGPEAKQAILSGQKKVADFNPTPLFSDAETVPETLPPPPGEAAPLPAKPKPLRGTAQVGYDMIEKLQTMSEAVGFLVEMGRPNNATYPSVITVIGRLRDALTALEAHISQERN